MGFDRFPKVRWDNTVLRDILLYMTTIANMVDRRMLSYETALQELGFDFNNELNSMESELDLVLDGVFGLRGSPFQQNKGIQPGGAPSGTPSDGRPKNQVPKTKQTDPTQKTKTKNKKPKPSQQPGPSPQAASLNLKEVVDIASQNLDDEKFLAFIEGLSEGLNGQ
jgi:hypothetical protein